MGRTVFKAEVRFDELVRTLGLAYVWQVTGDLGILAVFSEALSCVAAPVQIIAWMLMIVAWLIASKEALDLECVQTVVVVILGWLAQFVITTIITGLALPRWANGLVLGPRVRASVLLAPFKGIEHDEE